MSKFRLQCRQAAFIEHRIGKITLHCCIQHVFHRMKSPVHTPAVPENQQEHTDKCKYHE